METKEIYLSFFLCWVWRLSRTVSFFCIFIIFQYTFVPSAQGLFSFSKVTQTFSFISGIDTKTNAHREVKWEVVISCIYLLVQLPSKSQNDRKAKTTRKARMTRKAETTRKSGRTRRSGRTVMIAAPIYWWNHARCVKVDVDRIRTVNKWKSLDFADFFLNRPAHRDATGGHYISA
jgi:hypothetical protein